MVAKIELQAQTRTEGGTRASRRVRNNNQVIGIVYGAHKPATKITLDENKIKKAMENEAFYASILTLSIDNEAEKVVVKAIQRHPYKPKLLHVDFFRINPKEKLTMRIPLHFLGENQAPGVKEGGVFSHLITEVDIRCLPADLPEFIEVDLSNVALNEYIHLTDLKLPKGAELVALSHKGEENNLAVAHLHLPHVIAEPVETAPISPEVEATRVSANKEAEGTEGSK